MKNPKWVKGLILLFFLSTVGIGVEWKKIKESYELAQIVKKDEECGVKADEKEKRLLHLYEEKKEEEARKLKKEIREDFERKYRGKWVVIAGGEVVAIGDSIGEVLEEANKVTNYMQDRILWKVGEKIEEGVVRRIRGRGLRRKQL